MSTTQQSFEAVLKSLAVYRSGNKRLPCPGENGMEIYGKAVGEAPYKDLFLEKKMASDGNGNVLLYIVDRPSTIATPKTGLEGFWDDDYEEFTNSIEIYDEEGELLTPAAQTKNPDFCAVVLMSIPPNLLQQLPSIISEDGDSITIRLPPRSAGLSIRWMSSNNLNMLNK
jgi:hypothetical protein